MNVSAFTHPDRVRYFLWHPASNQKQKIYEPKGWGSNNKSFSRDKTPLYFGVVRKTSDNLVFLNGKEIITNPDTLEREEIFGGYDFILSIRDVGVNEDLTVIREERNNVTNSWTEAYTSYLDLSTLDKKVDKNLEKTCSLKSSDTGLDSFINSRQDDELEVEKTETMDGEVTALIGSDAIGLSGRDIEMIYLQKNSEDTLYLRDFDHGTIVSDIVYSSILANFFQAISTSVSKDFPSSYFWADNEDKKESKFLSENFKYTIDYELKVSYIDPLPAGGTPIDVDIVSHYRDRAGNEYDIIKQTHTDLVLNDVFTGDFTTSLDTYDISGIRSEIRFDSSQSPGAVQRAGFDIIKWEISIDAVSIQEPTLTKAYSVYNLYDKLTTLISNKENSFKSDFLGAGGVGEKFFVTDGALVRNIPDWKTTLSLKDLSQAMSATWGLGLGIERKGFKDTLRVEELKYFFNTTVVIKLGQLTEIGRKTASEYIYSSTNVGYDGDSKIEGVQGLDKTAGLVKRVSTITRLKNEFEKISKIQSDDYLREQQRRLQYVNDPTLDAKNDEMKMFLDVKDNDLKSSFNLIFNTNVLLGESFSVSTQLVPELPILCTFTLTPSTASDCIMGVSAIDTRDNFLNKIAIFHTNYTWEIVSDNEVKITHVALDKILSSFTTTDVFSEKLSISINNEYTLTQRKQTDDFDSLPTGVFNPEGLTNGRWTPLAMQLRHGWWVKAGLSDYLNSKLTFGSSNSNTGLTGTLKNDQNFPYLNGIEYSENSNINVSDLEGNLFYPEWITGKHVVTQEIIKQLEGYTVIDGEEVKNFYCLCSFINEEQEEEDAFIFDVKPNGDGFWKFLTFKKFN